MKLFVAKAWCFFLKKKSSVDGCIRAISSLAFVLYIHVFVLMTSKDVHAVIEHGMPIEIPFVSLRSATMQKKKDIPMQ
jgi:hypothetical protein